jgi:hypothetical protein
VWEVSVGVFVSVVGLNILVQVGMVVVIEYQTYRVNEK